ncbi:metal-dependent hydrolase family protein [Amycolatopsis panacis]|uniref:Amidohydrolase family protein n=1 Tax=Amycolatopsis panacis TaxID=2340917 RepID=A0A419I4Z9_9PSEU|nr:amidohydrolase family protein [Amycolatopsis panacis]RJQ85572.1 amidohydrolase family protein [Amycolatopsis panacis]
MTDLIIHGATLADLATGESVPGSSVRVAGDRIVEVAPGRRLTGTAPAFDAGGRTLLPGFIDAHVHATVSTLDLPVMMRRPTTRRAIEAAGILSGMLRRGFTTVRDAGGLDRGIAEALDTGVIPGPRVFRSGRVISQTGGHGDLAPEDDESPSCACNLRTTWFAQVADGADAVRRAVREELKNGAHQIKVMASGGVSSPADSVDMVQYTSDELRAAVGEARSRGTYVLAHAFVPDAIVQAVTAGVRSIEHGNLLDAKAAQVMAEHDAFLVPTLVVFEQLAEIGRRWNYPSRSLEKLERVQAEGARAVRLAVDAGVRLGFGTDLLGESHPAQSREFLLRGRVQSPLDVLRSATVVNAELLDRTGELGVVAPGACADLLLVDGDPLADLSVLVNGGVEFVMQGGEVVHSPS